MVKVGGLRPGVQVNYSYERGFEIGSTEKHDGEGAAYLNNHVRLTVFWGSHAPMPT